MINLAKKFQRHTEDFTCQKCGAKVKGDGYTNHCPLCLWSKHVDINPGDRLANCGGLMKPVSIEKRGENYFILHRCERCGHQRKNKVQQADDFEKVISVSVQSK